MNGPDGSPKPETAWEIFVLASCAGLARFPQVHLAPKFPPGRLNLALRTQLPLLKNELLVALIDSDVGSFQSEIILTTARLYWTQREPATTAGNRSKGPAAIRAYGVDYALIAPGVSVESSGENSVQIALGSGQSLPLEGGGRELADALANYLHTVADAARKGADPSLEGLDPGLIRRISEALPRVAEVTQRTRILNLDMNTFRRDLLAATRRVVVTPLLLTACILVFVVMTLRGVDPFMPSARELLSWGANDGARVVLRHEAWRLPASVFIHGGLLHLAVNMWCLFNIGPLVERFFGNIATAVLYLAAGVGGSIASMAMLPVRISVGASGAIFGLLGALLAFLLINHRSVPTTVLRPLRSSALSFVVFNTLLGAAIPNIDQSAHIGGLVTGFLGGLMLIRPWPVIRSRWLTMRRLMMGLALVGAVLGAGVAAVRWREHTLPPQTRLEDFNDQAAPAIDEFNALTQALPRADELEANEATAESKQVSFQALRSLNERATTNLGRLGGIITPDPGLQAMCQALMTCQSAQIATLSAGLEYLETRNPDRLTGPSGFDASQAAMMRALVDFQNRQRTYDETHGIVPRRPDPGE